MTAVYRLAMAVVRAEMMRTLPTFTPDPPWRSWIEPCGCPDPWTDHPRLYQEQGMAAYLEHMHTIYKHGWRYGKGKTEPAAAAGKPTP